MSTPDDEPRRGTAAPLIAAVSVVVVVGAIIGVLSATSSPEENLSEGQRVGGLMVEYIEAARSDDAAAVAALQCTGIENAPLSDDDGTAELNNITEIRVNGDEAEADLEVTIGGSEANVTWNAVREGDEWRVCSS